MNLLFRLLRVILQAVLGKPLKYLDTSVLNFRVWPHDLDVNYHMTNSRYLSLMDLGRTDLLIRSGLAKKILPLRWGPVLGAANIRWRKALNVFDQCQLLTRIVGWDDKWIYIEQRITHNKDVYAIAIVKGLFVGRQGSIPIQTVVDLLNPGLKSPKLPHAVKLWNEMEDEIRTRLNEESERG